jgi:tetratricopeptide (TPR) repeat protein
VLVSGYVNLSQLYAELHEPEHAVEASREAIPLLKRLGNRIGLAQTHWAIGILFRGQGNASAAIEAFRAAQAEFEDIQMRADVAALNLIIADLLLELGQDREARQEIEAALPVIEDYKLVPEGVAALSLLRQSLQNQRINRTALRQLHGYFPES